MKKTVMLAALLAACGALAADKPNIVYILCDDLGYGDIRALNPERCNVTTPHVDRLTREGMVFTDAHSGSAVCTPTRYGILTGRYAWRTRLQSGVLGGFSPPLISAERLTVPGFLGQHGYDTVCIGKWHLGMTMPGRQGAKLTDAVESGAGAEMEWSRPIADGPVTRGFDRYFGISASLDMPPFAFIENDRFTQAPTATKKWLRQGPAAPDFEAEDVLPTLGRKTCEYIAGRAKSGKPFFIYLPLASPHTPIVPTPDWQGRSGLSPYGDFVMQTDDVVGKILKALDDAGIATNTLVVFTSDNGCSPAANTKELEEKGHFASADRRGYKADIWDGGHRVPFIVRWPARVQAGSTTPELTCLTDLLATCAEIVGGRLPDQAGEDSVSMLPAMLGRNREPLREAVIHHSIGGKFSVRQGKWKLELCAGSGGWSVPKDPVAGKEGLPSRQLYDMSADAGERTNLQDKHPEVIRALTELLEKYIADGRSTPGAPQTNDVAIDIWKHDAPGRKKK